jgi:hypothetical protein
LVRPCSVVRVRPLADRVWCADVGRSGMSHVQVSLAECPPITSGDPFTTTSSMRRRGRPTCSCINSAPGRCCR